MPTYHVLYIFQVRLYYNAKVDLSLSQLEVMVMYFNESQQGGSSYSSTPMHFLTSSYRMDMKTEGWQRWEALLPPHIQLRLVDRFNYHG